MKFPRIHVPKWVNTHLLRAVVIGALSITVAVLATLALVAYVTSAKQAKQALDTRQDTATAARSRIDQLQAQIAGLQGDGQGRQREIGELQTQVAALAEQIRQAGRKPVITPTTTVKPSTTSTVRPAAASATRTTATTSPRPSSPPMTTTTSLLAPSPRTCRTVPVVDICLPHPFR